MLEKDISMLQRALDRQKKARQMAERILEEKSKELYDTAQHLKQANARLTKLVGTNGDVTDDAFINIIDPYVVMDLGMNVIKTNDSAKEFLGFDYTKETMNLTSLVHPDFMQYTTESMKVLLQVGKLKNYTAKIYTKNKVEKFVQINASLIYNKESKPIAAQGIIRDITRAMEIEDLLARQRRKLDAEHLKFSSIIANMNLGLVEVDLENNIQMVNQSFCEMSGYVQEELVGQCFLDIIDVQNKELVETKSKQRLDGVSDSYTIEIKNKNGELQYWLISGAPIYDHHNNVKGSIGIHLDMTEHKELELQKEKLVSKLEESNKGLQEYAHIVSHDLKSPLRSISALATWMYEDYKDKLDETGQQNLKMMQEKIASMDKLISGILEYSTAKSSTLVKSKVDLNYVIREIKNTIYVPEHVSLEVPKVLPTIMADVTKMRQLFQNIISNAVAHIERKEGLVEVLFEESDNHWKFTVSDNGIGIPEKYHKKIFEIFQSVGSGKASTGIGLSIVKKIVDRYKGKVWIDSEVGVGTQFHFTLSKDIVDLKE